MAMCFRNGYMHFVTPAATFCSWINIERFYFGMRVEVVVAFIFGIIGGGVETMIVSCWSGACES